MFIFFSLVIYFACFVTVTVACLFMVLLLLFGWSFEREHAGMSWKHVSFIIYVACLYSDGGSLCVWHLLWIFETYCTLSRTVRLTCPVAHGGLGAGYIRYYLISSPVMLLHQTHMVVPVPPAPCSAAKPSGESEHRTMRPTHHIRL